MIEMGGLGLGLGPGLSLGLGLGLGSSLVTTYLIREVFLHGAYSCGFGFLFYAFWRLVACLAFALSFRNPLIF
ncbi:hypothetical protein B0I37DRAFT_375132 [Chaetomium sp. MPI-CAGE-AT-0009]|nr:hypothetical protein B0I37DRAFT_375132 [Chaetomium sp. MPI-CAGE-AT-0009]